MSYYLAIFFCHIFGRQTILGCRRTRGSIFKAYFDHFGHFHTTNKAIALPAPTITMMSSSPSRRDIMAAMVNASGGVSSSGQNAGNNFYQRECTPEGSFDSQDLEDQPLVASGTALMSPTRPPPAQAGMPQSQQHHPAAPTTVADRWAARKAAIRKAIEYVITSSS